MTHTCSEWVLARRNHPSILLWRPVDVSHRKLERFMPRDQFLAKLDDVVRRNDPAHRPLADASPSADIVAWGQPPGEKESNKLENFAPVENAARDTTKPILCKEIYGGFRDVPATLRFFRTYYEKSFALKSTGTIVQNLPLLAWSQHPAYAVQWLSASGQGNRDKPTSSLSGESRELVRSLPAGLEAVALRAGVRPVVEAISEERIEAHGRRSAAGCPGIGPSPRLTGLAGPAYPALANPRGILAATDGTAWIVAPQSGRWRLSHQRGEKLIEFKSSAEGPLPGYAHVQRVNAGE